MASTGTPITDELDQTPDTKPNLSFWQMISMSFGFLGIQYGFGLQQANMSPIYRYLGAEESSIPGLWLAGPLTGLLLQPIIGALSDRSWSPRWGRRKPYIFIGAIVGSIAMIMMPNSKSVFIAACLMWMLDAGLNSSMEPFRAFVGDLLNKKQRPTGFAIQSFMVGFGQTLANLMPFLLPLVGLAIAAGECDINVSTIPNSVRYSFYFGAIAILLTVFYTIRTTQEYPPVNDDYLKPHTFTAQQEKNIKFWHMLLAGAAGLMGGLFAVRLSFLNQSKAFADGLKLTKWNEIFGSLKSTGANPELLNKINYTYNEWGVSHEKLHEVTTALNCANQDPTAWNASTASFVEYCKDGSNFALTDAQFNNFIWGAIQNGLIWGVGIFIGLFILLRLSVFKEILASLSEMPPVMKQLWWVKFFTWYGLPLMWQYLSLAAAKHAFNAPNPEVNRVGFKAGGDWGNLCFAMFSISCFAISVFIPAITKRIGSQRLTHAIFLGIGALGFFLTLTSNDKMIFLVAMTIVGLAWGSIMSLPYLMLANSVSAQRMGVYMGIFNGFICVPQFISMLTVPLYYDSLLGDPRNALVLAGICLLCAAGSCFLVKENK
jgi:MFS family permease